MLFSYFIFFSKAALLRHFFSFFTCTSDLEVTFLQHLVRDSRRSDRFLGIVARNPCKTKTWSVCQATRPASSARVSSATAICETHSTQGECTWRETSSDWNSSIRTFPLVFEFTDDEEEEAADEGNEKGSQRFNSIYEVRPRSSGSPIDPQIRCKFEVKFSPSDFSAIM